MADDVERNKLAGPPEPSMLEHAQANARDWWNGLSNSSMWRGIQDAPNSVPGRTMRSLNDFAEQASRVPEGATSHLTAPHSLNDPRQATFIGPQWLSLLSNMTRGVARDAMGQEPMPHSLWPEYSARRAPGQR